VAKANFLAQRLAFQTANASAGIPRPFRGCEIISEPLTWLGEGRSAKDKPGFQEVFSPTSTENNSIAISRTDDDPLRNSACKMVVHRE